MSTTLRTAQLLVRSFTGNEHDDTLSALFNQNEHFLHTVKKFDEWLTQNPGLMPVSEYLFDLLLAHHLMQQRGNEDYLFSKEWMDIEDKTIDRGSEFLNLLLYISEAYENDIEIDLEDFLNEFLLVDEDEFQDEHHIYETIIDNADIMALEIPALNEVVSQLQDDNLPDLLKPMLLFFYSPKKRIQADYLSPVEQALYDSLIEFAAAE
ncbi:MAG: hypothetical protein ACK5GX_06140 [Bacteroidota bacterium]|jgi:hypothetical protein